MAMAQAARDAARAQIAYALQSQPSSWQAPREAIDGACALRAEPASELACDNDALREVIGAHADALSGLLRAYHELDANAKGVSIAFSQGRYRVAFESSASGSE